MSFFFEVLPNLCGCGNVIGGNVMGVQWCFAKGRVGKNYPEQESSKSQLLSNPVISDICNQHERQVDPEEKAAVGQVILSVTA